MASTVNGSHSEVCLTGITFLKSPGEASNFLDWEFKVELALEAVKLSYVLSPVLPKDCSNKWIKDNTKACALISRAVEDGNLKFIKPFRRDAAGMWASLQQAHEDSTSGGRMHLLHRLITTRMEGEDVESHINSLHAIFELLDSLISAEAPRTVDEIFLTSILTSLPPDWLPVITPLMQRVSVDSAMVIRAIRNEATRRKTSSSLSLTSDVVASRTTSSSRPANTPSTSSCTKNSKFCTYCERSNHDVQNCWIKQSDESS